MNMKICSFNIQNNFFNHKDKTSVITELVLKYDLDILGVQEYLNHDAKKFNLDKYKCVGRGRFKHFDSIFNETCSVITKYEVIKHKTYKLPWFFTSLPRIMTEVVIKHNNKEYLVLNAHLDYLHKISQRKQLKYIVTYLKKITNNKNIIMMGDFNLNIHSKIFKLFISKLNELNISRVDINEKTYKNLDKPIDHIFISNNLSIKNLKIIKDKDMDVSDHYPLYIEIK